MAQKVAVIELFGYTESTMSDEQYLAIHMFFQHFVPDVEEIYVMDGTVGVSPEWVKVKRMILEDYPETEYIDIYTLDEVDLLTSKTFWYKL